MVRYYASLAATFDGQLLEQQCGITIVDGVNRAARVIIESVVPDDGPEVLAGRRVGEDAEVSVFILTHRKELSEPLLVLRGPIVGCEYSQPQGPERTVTQKITVEQRLTSDTEKEQGAIGRR